MINRISGRSFGSFAIAALLGCALPVAAEDAAPALYTTAQADQGQALYTASCAMCHGAQLEGGVGPTLIGPDFHKEAASEKLTPKSLLAVMSATMPMTAPASLKPDQYAALTAFILSKNGYPAGSVALSAASPKLDGIDMGIDPAAAKGASAAPAADAGPPARLASSGVYTADQANQGKQLYADNCMQCHGGELDGADGGTALTGQPFAHWLGQPVGAIHAFIDANMPPGNGGALGAVQEAQVVAYILQKNGYPAGATPLPADPIGLKSIILK